jgi:hypothetical protein
VRLSPGERELYSRAGELLRRSFGEVVLAAEDEPAYFVPLGRIGVRVGVERAGDDGAVLEAYAWIAQGLAVSPALGLHLAERNAALRFGALCIDGEGDVILQDALFAESVDGVVLERLVRVLAQSADALDAELRARFG